MFLWHAHNDCRSKLNFLDFVSSTIEIFILKKIWQSTAYCYIYANPSHACILQCCAFHYSDAIMSTMASQITSLMIVCSTVYSRRRSGNSPVTGEFPAQRASNAENVSIWWCHHVLKDIYRETGGSSGWLSWSSLETLKTRFNISSDDQGTHIDELSISVLYLHKV